MPRSRLMPAAAILLLPLAGCVTAHSDVAACPPLKTYTAAQQRQAAAELAALPAGSAIGRMIGDYGTLRDQVRACRAKG